jgi:hypothetical protein
MKYLEGVNFMAENELMEIATKVAVEVAKDRSKDVYEDGLKPATKEAGEALQAVVGLFNNVVLYPVKKANITFKYKLEQFENDLKMKLSKTPEEKIIESPLTISGPTFEALKYTYDTKELREMYLNLLAASMNVDTVAFTHPAYVDIIKVLTPLDAVVFKKVNQLEQAPCARMKIYHDDKCYLLALPQTFAPDLIGEYDPFLVSSSIDNLCRLGILLIQDASIVGYNYEEFKENSFVKQRLEFYKMLNSSSAIEMDKKLLSITDFGRNFAKVCLD